MSSHIGHPQNTTSPISNTHLPFCSSQLLSKSNKPPILSHTTLLIPTFAYTNTYTHTQTKNMASVSMAMPITYSSHKGLTKSFFNPLPLNPSPNKAVFVISRASKGRVIKVEASFKEKVISGATAGVLTAAMLVPDVAQAASGVSPSLNNFLVSIVSGGVVLVGIIGAVVGVSNFDPVKRT